MKKKNEDIIQEIRDADSDNIYLGIPKKYAETFAKSLGISSEVMFKCIGPKGKGKVEPSELIKRLNVEEIRSTLLALNMAILIQLCEEGIFEAQLILKEIEDKLQEIKETGANTVHFKRFEFNSN
ncbi:MAG: hypothetical protein ACOYXB_00615 [Bacteroidota bacterium]